MTLYDLTFEEKNEIEKNILNFKKEKFDEFIHTAILLGELAVNMKNNKSHIVEKIDKISPIWIRLMSEEVDNLMFSMKELVYQINNYDKYVLSQNCVVDSGKTNLEQQLNKVDDNQLTKYRKLVLKKEKTKRIIKPLINLLKNNIEKI